MRTFSRQLGARIKQLREELGVSVLDFAGATHVKKSTIYNIESGRFHPSMKLLPVLAENLHVDELDLLCFPEQHARHQLIDLLRKAPLTTIVAIKEQAGELLRGKPPKPRRKPRRG